MPAAVQPFPNSIHFDSELVSNQALKGTYSVYVQKTTLHGRSVYEVKRLTSKLDFIEKLHQSKVFGNLIDRILALFFRNTASRRLLKGIRLSTQNGSSCLLEQTGAWKVKKTEIRGDTAPTQKINLLAARTFGALAPPSLRHEDGFLSLQARHDLQLLKGYSIDSAGQLHVPVVDAPNPHDLRPYMGSSISSSNSRLRVPAKQLTEQPLRTLLQLYREEFQNEARSELSVKFLDQQGRVLPGSDSGGLSRALITKIFSGLQKEELIRLDAANGGLIPSANEDGSMTAEQKEILLALGWLMSICLAQKGEMLTPATFDQSVYNVISTIRLNDLGYTFDQLPNDRLLDLYGAFKANDVAMRPYFRMLHESESTFSDADLRDAAGALYFDEDETPAALKGSDGSIDLAAVRSNFAILQKDLKEMLLDQAKAASKRNLKAIFTIAQGMHRRWERRSLNSVWPKWDELCQVLEGSHLQKSIEGEQKLTAEYILARTQVNDDTIQGWLAQWLLETTDKFRTQFVEAVTGSPAIGPNRLHVYNYHQSRRPIGQDAPANALPRFGTCGRSMSLPVYENYETFKQKLEQAITHSLRSESGFTTA